MSNWGATMSNWGAAMNNWGATMNNWGAAISNWGAAMSNWGAVITFRNVIKDVFFNTECTEEKEEAEKVNESLKIRYQFGDLLDNDENKPYFQPYFQPDFSNKTTFVVNN
ncbi:MAG: hypothetical protein LBU34_01320 [Planctomycetaceae bacterium]|jgi:hypothetical protein|nr:hypothetical protein [Planctomycetaceae bacterium]